MFSIVVFYIRLYGRMDGGLKNSNYYILRSEFGVQVWNSRNWCSRCAGTVTVRTTWPCDADIHYSCLGDILSEYLIVLLWVRNTLQFNKYLKSIGKWLKLYKLN